MTAKADGEKSANLAERDTDFDLAVKPILSAEKKPYRLPGKEKMVLHITIKYCVLLFYTKLPLKTL
jgi:hypothetical protein